MTIEETQKKYQKAAKPSIAARNGKQAKSVISLTIDKVVSQLSAELCSELSEDSQALQLSLQEDANAYFANVHFPDSVDENHSGFAGFAIPLQINREPKHYRLAFEACARQHSQKKTFIQSTSIIWL